MRIPRKRLERDRRARRGLARIACAAGTLLSGLLLASASPDPAGAAEPPPVQVDLGALDQLPPPKTPPGQTVRLHPPPPARPAKPSHPAVTAHLQPAAPPNAGDAGAKPAAQAARAPVAAPAQAAPPPPAPAPTPPPAAANAEPAETTESSPAPPVQVANRPPETTPAAPVIGPVADTLLFVGDGAQLSEAARTDLAGFAKRLAADPKLRLQLVAYAGSGGDSSDSRRLSLQRALAARSFLLDQGVDSKQIDLRPLGGKSDPGTPPDRVDLVVMQQPH
jgi:outer membrane protein OmpA-like peptidoglycan-associated protein